MKTLLKKQYGFAIIETLIALVVVGFGILSLAGMQSAILRNIDDSQQRTEATRFAQEKIEYFRSFTGISSTTLAATSSSAAAVSSSALNWSALTSSTSATAESIVTNTNIVTNTTYTRSWTFTGTTSATMRTVNVNVAWTDRAGESQSVSLSSVLSKTDPADSGILGFPLPQNSILKRPLDRNIDIPIPSIDLGTGSSAYKFGTSGQYVTLSNISGNVVGLCSPSLVSNPTNAQVIAALTSSDTAVSNCTTINGYFVTGYINKDSSMSASDWAAISSGTDMGIDFSGISRNAAGSTGISCPVSDAVDQNSGATIADTKYYICVIPLTAPSTALTSNGPYNWSGPIRISGPTVWHASGNKYYVCRYQYTSTNSVTNSNRRNVQGDLATNTGITGYSSVNQSLDLQNYLIATTNNATTTAQPTCPSAMTVTGVSTGVLHQDCRSASNSSSYASTCQTTSASATYTVTYNSNATLTSGAVPTDSNNYASGANVTVNSNTGSMTRTGYTFAGWSLTTSGSAVSSFTITASTTLYAQWTAGTTLSPPVPTWPNVPGSNNDDLTWSLISNATGYKIKTCTTTENGICSPTTVATTISITTYSPTVSNNSALCITVTTTNGTIDSSASSNKCVSRSGGTYTHY